MDRYIPFRTSSQQFLVLRTLAQEHRTTVSAVIREAIDRFVLKPSPSAGAAPKQ